MSEELSSLKQEVAELWSRFRKEEAVTGGDTERQALAEQARALETKRRLLAERRAALKERFDTERRRASRFVPVVMGLGGVVGLVVGGVLAMVGAEAVAALSADFTPGVGAVLVALSTLALPPLLHRG
jgi:hypothetical protein